MALPQGGNRKQEGGTVLAGEMLALFLVAKDILKDVDCRALGYLGFFVGFQVALCLPGETHPFVYHCFFKLT